MTAKLNTAQIIQQLHDLQAQVDGLEKDFEEFREEVRNGTGSAKKATGGRTWTEEERKAAGERLQMGRATKLGLDSIEQLRALHLRPGEKPSKADIRRVKAKFPVEDVEDDITELADDEPEGAFGYSEDELSTMKVSELRDLAEEYELELPARAKKAEIVQILLDA